MARSAVQTTLATLGVAAALTTTAAMGDDWAQFRRDSVRSGRSQDRLNLPLTEIWSADSQAASGSSPLYNCAVWRDRVYYHVLERGKRSLVCADAKTGSMRWKRPMQMAKLKYDISRVAGPAVSADGTVFVYDWVGSAPIGVHIGPNGKPVECAAMNTFTVRTFDAVTGVEGGYFPLIMAGANGVLRRVSLVDSVIGQEVQEVPPTFSGYPP